MDKTSIFFTANCGICHPGGAAMEFDRTGKKYISNGLYGYNDAATLPAEARLDGDYGFINPSTGAPGTANWAKTGVTEPDCLMCHLTQYATGPGTANHNNGLSWHKRTGALRGAIGGTYQNGFTLAPTAGAGWAAVSYTGASPPMASSVTVNYGLGVTAGTLVTLPDGSVAIPLDKVGAARDANCRGCHTIPDGKKSGRTLLPTSDVHVGKVGCTGCHPSSPDGQHQIAKGDITIGSVRNDLDGGVLDCEECHVKGLAPAGMFPPDPATAHASIPSLHFGTMKCQVCHIRYLDDDPVSPTAEIPDFVIEMTSNGTQNVSNMSAYLKTDPLDPTKDLAELAGRPYRWYPTARWYKGKLTTVKPLWTAWFGEWLGGEGDGAIIQPYALRLVRRTFTVGNSYAAGAARDTTTFPLTPGTQVTSGAPILHTKAEIRAALLALRGSVDTANTTTPNDIAVRPVLVRADKVYYLNDLDEVEWFHSHVAESHDFAVNHNSVAKRDPANPVVQPGPWGSGGCTDCHSAQSPFFFGKKLAEPAQYDFLDEAGTVPNPEAGHPEYVEAWEIMGYSAYRVATLTGDRVAVNLQVGGWGPGSRVIGGGIDCGLANGVCTTSVAVGGTLVLTAHPGVGAAVKAWRNCTPSADLLTCSVEGTDLGALGGAKVVYVEFGIPDQTPRPTTYGVALTVVGTGWGTVTGNGIVCNLGTQGDCNEAVPAPGTVVTLTATPGPHSWIDGWTGCTPSADLETCTLTAGWVVNDVQAVFSNGSGGGEYSLTQRLTAVPFGLRPGNKIVENVATPRIDCTSASDSSGPCAYDVATDDTVQLRAEAGSGSTFVRWEGCASVTNGVCSVTMDVPRTVFAVFSP